MVFNWDHPHSHVKTQRQFCKQELRVRSFGMIRKRIMSAMYTSLVYIADVILFQLSSNTEFSVCSHGNISGPFFVFFLVKLSSYRGIQFYSLQHFHTPLRRLEYPLSQLFGILNALDHLATEFCYYDVSKNLVWSQQEIKKVREYIRNTRSVSGIIRLRLFLVHFRVPRG